MADRTTEQRPPLAGVSLEDDLRTVVDKAAAIANIMSTSDAAERERYAAWAMVDLLAQAQTMISALVAQERTGREDATAVAPMPQRAAIESEAQKRARLMDPEAALSQVDRIASLLRTLRTQLDRLDEKHFPEENPDVVAAEACIESALTTADRAANFLDPLREGAHHA